MLLSPSGNPTVDYFSLDVEGSELPILQTIPWSNVTINAMTIEVGSRKEDKKSIVKYMNHQDIVFVHKRLQSNIDDWVQKDYIY